MKKAGELERAVEFVARKLSDRVGIVVLLDADDDCPALLGPELSRRADRARSDMAWFIAAAESLRGRRGLPADLTSPENPESIVGAKEWLAIRMSEGKYVATLDQPALAAQFDLESARKADSFDKLYRDVSRILGTTSPSVHRR